MVNEGLTGTTLRNMPSFQPAPKEEKGRPGGEATLIHKEESRETDLTTHSDDPVKVNKKLTEIRILKKFLGGSIVQRRCNRQADTLRANHCDNRSNDTRFRNARFPLSRRTARHRH